MNTSSGFLKYSLLCAALCAGIQTQAQILVSDLDPASLGGGALVASDAYFAQGFTTPSGTTYSLDSISVPLLSSGPGSGTYDVSLWSSAAGKPSSQALLVSSGNQVSALTGSYVTHTFNSSAFTLTPSTAYFVVLSASAPSSSSTLVWGDNTAFPTTTSGPGTLGGWTKSVNQGGSWGNVVATFPLQIEVAATAVPEPSAYAVVAGLALVAFGVTRKCIRQPRAAS
jgi:hypothetical protein